MSKLRTQATLRKSTPHVDRNSSRVGSNVDYEIIENEHANGMSGTSPEMVRHISVQPSSNNSENKERLPISSLDNSAMKKERQNPFSLDASDSDGPRGSC
ncbi:hypothetical protein JCM33374_g2231 [Metschnikowia sp. JCM 33374]|nr:hypothetical protein JCM33374_g2231 [Metschnikowia sp. JCM 33374]